MEAAELVEELAADEASVELVVLDVEEEDDAAVHSIFGIIAAWLFVVIPPA